MARSLEGPGISGAVQEIARHVAATPTDDDAIYLYEDDEALAAEITLAFATDGSDVHRLPDEHALRTCALAGEGVLVLDRMVGDRDSLDLLQGLRANGCRIPVLVISSLATVDDRIFGLKTGGDDYLVKPFAMGELIARVTALRRRATPRETVRLDVGRLSMDLLSRGVTLGGRKIDLLPREFSLLQYFMRHAGQVVTRTMLLEDVWHYRLSTQTNVVDVHVGNLRRKLEAPGGERLIDNVRGLGFRLRPDKLLP